MNRGPSDDLVIGVDAGGTKTVAWLASRSASVTESPCGTGEAGPGNPRSVGFGTALMNLEAAIDAAFINAGRTRSPVAAACLSLAGAGRETEQSRVRTWAATGGWLGAAAPISCVPGSGSSEQAPRGAATGGWPGAIAPVPFVPGSGSSEQTPRGAATGGWLGAAAPDSFAAGISPDRESSPVRHPERKGSQQALTGAGVRPVARRIRITGDAEPVLAAASPKNWGIALISGTGSFAWGRNAQGQTARAGGWGYLMGDEGSAYALVLAGLRAAARAADGRGPATELLASFQQRLDAPTPADLIERVYGAEMTREKIADLAAVVFETAGNDPVSGRIVESALDDLVLLVSTLAERLALPPGTFPLALAGGVLLNQDRFRVELVRRLGLEPDTVSLVMEPVRGAVVLARMELDSGIET